MTYVHILRSLEHPGRHYVGVTEELRSRLKKHNAGKVTHISKYAPWAIKTYIAFSDEKQAFALQEHGKRVIRSRPVSERHHGRASVQAGRCIFQ